MKRTILPIQCAGEKPNFGAWSEMEAIKAWLPLIEEMAPGSQPTEIQKNALFIMTLDSGEAQPPLNNPSAVIQGSFKSMPVS